MPLSTSQATGPPQALNRNRCLVVFFLGAVLGAVIWLASPSVTGKREPWDSPSYYYVVALFLAGFVAALPYPRAFWIAAVGVYVGQFAYAFAVIGFSPLAVVGVVFGLFYCVIAVVGAALMYGTSILFRRFRRIR
jgi:hypothetical protein